MSNRPTLDDETLGIYVGLVNRLCSLVEVPPDLLLCLNACRDSVTDQLVHPPETADYWDSLARGSSRGIDEIVAREAPLIAEQIREYGEEVTRAMHRLDPTLWPDA